MDSYSRDSARALPVILTFFLCAAVFAGTFFALLHFVGLPQSARAQEAGEEALSPEETMPPAEEISGESMAIATPEPQEPVQEPPEEETPEPEGVPVPVLGTLIETREDTVNFSFIGDILFDGNYATGSTMSARGGFANCLDAGTRELMQSADVLVANNEFTYTNTTEAFPGKTYTFRARPETVQWLKDAGVDLAALANNHVFDFQEQGLLDTLDTLDAAGVRAEVDDRNEKIGKKIREATLEKVPYMLVLGDRDIENKTVSVRTRGGEDKGAMSLDAFTGMITEEIRTRAR